MSRTAAAIERQDEHAALAYLASLQAQREVLRLRRDLARMRPGLAVLAASAAAERCDCAAAYCRQIIAEMERNDP